MKIGDEVYIHGFVDEIRKDTVIIRNKGGYFGTIEEEVDPIVVRDRGTWERIRKRYRCSECKAVALLDDYANQSLTDFCSCCGAKMERRSE